MSVLELYLNQKLVEKKGNAYMIEIEGSEKPTSLGIGAKLAEKKLSELISEGKVKDITLTGDPEPPSTKKAESVTPTDPIKETKESETAQRPPINPKLEEIPVSEEMSKAEQLMAANLGDIKTRGKHGKFRTFVYGVDTRSKDHPVIKKHPYVYRHCSIDKNVPSGDMVLNDGWSVFTKEMNPVDPRTGKARLTVAHDSTPKSNCYTVGKQVLCYASKEQFEEKKEMQVLENVLNTGRTLSKRQEQAYRRAKQSKDPDQVAESLQGYVIDNAAEIAINQEFLVESKGYTQQSAQEKLSQIQNDIALAKMGKGKGAFDTVLGAQEMSIDDI